MSPQKPSENDEAFRRLVEETDGDLKMVAATLGRHVSTVSARLHAEKNHAWWQAFKAKRAKRRRRATDQRSYQVQKARKAAEKASASADPAVEAVKIFLDNL